MEQVGHIFAGECFFLVSEDNPEDDFLLVAEGEEGMIGAGSRYLVKASSISCQ